MTSPCRPIGRWEHLIEAAFRLSESIDAFESGPGGDGEKQLAAARACLDDILEVFGSEIDPVDDLQAFAVRRLAVVLRRALPARVKKKGRRRRRR